MKTRNQLLAALLALVMFVGMLPISASAESGLPSPGTGIAIENPNGSEKEPAKEGTGGSKDQGNGGNGNVGGTPGVMPDPTYANITLACGKGGSVTDLSNTAKSGSIVRFKTVPETDYSLDTVSAHDSGGSNVAVSSMGDSHSFTMPVNGEDVTVTVQFKTATPGTGEGLPGEGVPSGVWAVTLNVTGQGQMCIVDSKGDNTNKTSFATGETVYLHLTADLGSELKSLTMNDTALTAHRYDPMPVSAYDNTVSYDASFTMPDGAVTVEAVFGVPDDGNEGQSGGATEAEAPDLREITPDCGAGGSFVDLPEKANVNDKVQFRVVPETDHSLDYVHLVVENVPTVLSGTDGAFEFDMPDCDRVTVVARFKENTTPTHGEGNNQENGPDTYPVTLACAPAAGGSISIFIDDGYRLPTDQRSFKEGETVYLQITANSGYTLGSLTMNDAALTPVRKSGGGMGEMSVYTASFTMPAQQADVTANFQKSAYTVTVAAEPAEGGSVSVQGDFTADSGLSADVLPGNSATVTAAANEGYVFAGWMESGSEVSTDTPYAFEPTGDTALTAKFKRKLADGQGGFQVSAKGMDDFVAHRSDFIYLSYTDFSDTARNVSFPLDPTQLSLYVDGSAYPAEYCLHETYGHCFKLDARALQGGTHSLQLRWAGDDAYAPHDSNAYELTLKKRVRAEYANPTDVIYTYEGAFRVRLLDDADGTPLKNTWVTIDINGEQQDRRSDDEGVVTRKIPKNPGEYTVTVTYDGDETHDPLNKAFAIEVRWPVRMVYDNPSGIVYTRQPEEMGGGFKIRLLNDADGTPVESGRDVTFIINGVNYYRKTDDEGFARLHMNLPPGKYDVAVRYDVYTQSYPVEVRRRVRVITHDLTKVYGSPDQFVVRLINDVDETPVARRTVQFNVNGVLYNRTSGNDGAARLNINLNPGQYIITTSADEFPVSNKITILPSGDHTVSVSASPEEGGTVEGGRMVAAGGSATVTATPNEGYTFIRWTEDGKTVSTDSACSFTVTGDRNLTAVFSDNPTLHTVTYAIEGGSFAEGTAATETVIDGHRPANVPAGMLPDESRAPRGAWYMGDGDTPVDPASVEITGPTAFTYKFEEKVNCTIKTSFAPMSLSGNIQVTGAGTYVEGSEVTLTATLAEPENQAFLGWVDSAANAVVSRENPYAFTAQQSMNLTAVFGPGSAPVTTHTVTYAIEGGSFAEGTVTTENVKNGENPANVPTGMTPDEDHKNTGAWYQGDGDTPVDPAAVSIIGPTTFTYKFDVKPSHYTVSLSANPAEGGSVMASSGQEAGASISVARGESVTVTATANKGYAFVGWYDGDYLVEHDASYSFTPKGDVALTARFQEGKIKTKLDLVVPLPAETFDWREPIVLEFWLLTEAGQILPRGTAQLSQFTATIKHQKYSGVIPLGTEYFELDGLYCTLTIPGNELTDGENNLTVSWAGNETYEGCSKTIEFTLKQKEDVLSFVGVSCSSKLDGSEPPTISGWLRMNNTSGLPDGGDAPRQSMRVKCEIQDAPNAPKPWTYSGTVWTKQDGSFTITMPDDAWKIFLQQGGTQSVILSVDPTETLTGARHSLVINYPTVTAPPVSKIKTKLFVKTGPTVVDPSESAAFVLIPLTEDDQPLPAGTVKASQLTLPPQATLDLDAEYNAGMVEVPASALSSGTNTLSLSWAGNETYEGCSATVTFTVANKQSLQLVDYAATLGKPGEPYTISGRFLDEDNKPLADTEITIRTQQEPGSTSMLPWFVTTDADGRFSYTVSQNLMYIHEGDTLDVELIVHATDAYLRFEKKDQLRFTSTPSTQYTVTFMDGSTELSALTQTVSEGGNASRPDPDPIKEGHSFKGWYADLGFGKTFDFTQEITADTTVYARFEPTAKVIYEIRINGFVSPVPGKAAKDCLHLSVPDGSHYTITKTGWFHEETNSWLSGETLFSEGKEYKCMAEITPENGYVVAEKSAVTFYANGQTDLVDLSYSWTREDLARMNLKAMKAETQHTVTFNIVNGTWEGGKTEKQVTVADGMTLAAGDVPKPQPASGYGVGAWDTDPVGQSVTGNATYTWSYFHYKVSYNTQGKGTAPAQTQSINSGSSANGSPDVEWYGSAAEVPMLSGDDLYRVYDAQGLIWFTDPDDDSSAVKPDTPIGADTTLYCKWVKGDKVVDAVSLSVFPKAGDPIPQNHWYPGGEWGELSAQFVRANGTDYEIGAVNWEPDGDTTFKQGKTYEVRVQVRTGDHDTSKTFLKGHATAKLDSSGDIANPEVCYALTVNGAASAKIDYVQPTESFVTIQYTVPAPSVSKPVNVTVTGKTASADYDGTEKSVSGFGFTAKDSDDGDVSGVTVTLKSAHADAASIAKTDAGDYDMGLKAEYFEITLPDGYTLGAVKVNDGKLTISLKAVTVTANNSSKQFGAADPEFTADVNGLIGTDTITYSVTRPGAGKDEAVRTYTGAIVATGETEQGNYTVTYKNGDFTITASDSLPLAVTPYSGVYDGTAHGAAATANVDGAEIEYSRDDGRTWSSAVPQIRDVGTIKVTAKAIADGYPVKIATYTLTVTPATLSITTDSASREYNGEALTAAGTITGLISGETATLTTTGSQTYVGSSKNTYTINWGTAKADNYMIKEDLGTLEVTAAAQNPTITATAMLTTGGNTLDLSKLVSGAQGTPTFSIKSGGEYATLSGTTLTSGDNPGTVVITVRIDKVDMNGDGKSEYKDYTGTVSITVEKNTNPPTPVTYTVTSGGGSTWTKGSAGTLDFTVTGMPDDSKTFGSFTGIEVNGVSVADENYTAAPGSVNIRLKSAYLEGLAAGEHTLTARFADGSAQAKFTVKEKEQPEPVYDVRFSFTKLWQGGAEDSLDWTFCNPEGIKREKGFNKTIKSETEWYYEAWFSHAVDYYYVVEEVPEGYNVRYENVGAYADVTDRCYNGGTIINYKVPKTGDDADLALWLGCALAGLILLPLSIHAGKRKKAHGK